MKTRTKVFRRIVAGLLALLLAGAVAAGAVYGPDVFSRFVFREGLRTLNGEAVETVEGFLEDFMPEGGMAYIVVYRTGCSACTLYLQELSRMDLEQFGGRLAVVAINAGESEWAVREHLKANDIPTSARFPVLIGLPFDPAKIESVPVTTVMLGDGESWRVGETVFPGRREIEWMETLAYKVLVRAWGGVSFWDDNLVVMGWYENDGHHAVWTMYTGKYEPTAVETAEMLAVLLRAAALEPDHGFYIHTVVYHETYGDYIAFTLYTDYATAQGFHVPDTEEEAYEALIEHFSVAAGEDYFWLDGRIPLWDGTRDAWHYARYAAIIAGHPWVEELGEIPE
jgi:hypothetical protein